MWHGFQSGRPEQVAFPMGLSRSPAATVRRGPKRHTLSAASQQERDARPSKDPMTIRSGTRTLRRRVPLLLSAITMISCTEPAQRVPGTMRFVLGGTSGAAASIAQSATGQASRQSASLVAGAAYIVSPKRARITFTSVIFRDATGDPLGNSEFTDCTVMYDRTLVSGSTLLDCDFTAPAGDIHQMAVYFDKNIEVLVSDATVGIYSDASVASKFSTVAPAGGATLTARLGGPCRSTIPMRRTPPTTSWRSAPPSGQTTVLNCKLSTSPPVPADGKTYASGAPAMSSPTTSRTLTLIAK